MKVLFFVGTFKGVKMYVQSTLEYLGEKMGYVDTWKRVKDLDLVWSSVKI